MKTGTKGYSVSLHTTDVPLFTNEAKTVRFKCVSLICTKIPLFSSSLTCLDTTVTKVLFEVLTIHDARSEKPNFSHVNVALVPRGT